MHERGWQRKTRKKNNIKRNQLSNNLGKKGEKNVKKTLYWVDDNLVPTSNQHGSQLDGLRDP